MCVQSTTFNVVLSMPAYVHLLFAHVTKEFIQVVVDGRKKKTGNNYIARIPVFPLMYVAL